MRMIVWSINSVSVRRGHPASCSPGSVLVAYGSVALSWDVQSRSTPSETKLCPRPLVGEDGRPAYSYIFPESLGAVTGELNHAVHMSSLMFVSDWFLNWPQNPAARHRYWRHFLSVASVLVSPTAVFPWSRLFWCLWHRFCWHLKVIVQLCFGTEVEVSDGVTAQCVQSCHTRISDHFSESGIKWVSWSLMAAFLRFVADKNHWVKMTVCVHQCWNLSFR